MTELEKNIKVNKNEVITYNVSQYEDRTSDFQSSTAILFIHGLASNMTRWTEFIENTVLSTKVDLVRLDLRGHGKSMSYSRISTEKWCQDIQAILQQEKYSSFILVGHSLGAQISMQFAYKYPQYTTGVVLIDPVFPTALKGILNIVRRFRYGLLIIIYILLIKNNIGFPKKTLPYRDLQSLDIKTREILRDKSDSNIAKLYMNPYDDLIYIPFVNYCQDMFEVTRKVPELVQINSAVLCLLSKGATVSNIKITKSYVAQFPHNEIEIIDADHWMLTEKPDESRVAIENWCTKILNNGKK